MFVYCRSKPDKQMWKTQLVIQPNGLMYLSYSVVSKISCPIDVTNFPFDEQTCKLRVGSLHGTLEYIPLMCIFDEIRRYRNLFKTNISKDEIWFLHCVIGSTYSYLCGKSQWINGNSITHLYFLDWLLTSLHSTYENQVHSVTLVIRKIVVKSISLVKMTDLFRGQLCKYLINENFCTPLQRISWVYNDHRQNSTLKNPNGSITDYYIPNTEWELVQTKSERRRAR